MSEVILLIKEQLQNIPVIKRVAKYEDRASYQNHYLGLGWEVLNPLIQIGIYYLVFGVALHAGQYIEGMAYFPWMMIGISAWLYIQAATMGMARSVYRKVGLVAKMKFPVSVLPSINMVSNLTMYWVMMIATVLSLIIYKTPISIYWVQYIYYFFCMICFLVATGILNSTLSILARDWAIALQSLMRMLFYMSGVLFNINGGRFPQWIVRILELNPIYYIIAGFRSSFMSTHWFWQEPKLTLYFWFYVLFIAAIGSHLHFKFRAHFVDLI